MVRTRKQSRREEEESGREAETKHVVLNELQEEAITMTDSEPAMPRAVLRVQEVKAVSVDGVREVFFVTRPVRSSAFKHPRVIVGTNPVVVYWSSERTLFSFEDHSTHPLPQQEVVTDGYNYFHITRPCMSTANQDHVSLKIKRPVYHFTSKEVALAYVTFNPAEFGAPANFECDFEHLHAYLDLLVFK